MQTSNQHKDTPNQNKAFAAGLAKFGPALHRLTSYEAVRFRSPLPAHQHVQVRDLSPGGRAHQHVQEALVHRDDDGVAMQQPLELVR